MPGGAFVLTADETFPYIPRMPSKPTRRTLDIFIGSARESLDEAEQVARWIESLGHGHTVSVWNLPGLFTAGSSVWTQLYNRACEVDAAVMIFGADDKIWSRGVELPQPRDNALLEFGLFAGRLGLASVAFCVKKKPKLPSDLDGIVKIDISGDRQYTAKYELEAWLKVLEGPDVQRGRSAREELPSVVRDFPRWDRSARKLGRARTKGGRQGIPLAKNLMAGFYPELIDRRTELFIDGSGEGRCAVTEKIRSRSSAIVSVPFIVAGDHPIRTLRQLEVRAWRTPNGGEVPVHGIRNEPMSKWILLTFKPAVPAGETVQYTTSWRWPHMWDRLAQGRADNWKEPTRSSSVIRKAAIVMYVDANLQAITVENRGNGGGELTSGGAIRRYEGRAYRRYTWTMHAIEPGRDVELSLVPSGASAAGRKRRARSTKS